MDVDSLLLDRLFQPVADRWAEWVSCFGLARLSLRAAVLSQILILITDLRSLDDKLQVIASAGVTMLALCGAQQAWLLIARCERQARPGAMNLRRITLRWQRLAWLAVTIWAVATGTSVGGETGLGLCGASLAWLGLIYFVSCSPASPSQRTILRQVLA